MTTSMNTVRNTTISIHRVPFFTVSTSFQLSLSHSPSTVRNLQLLIAFCSVVVRHRVLTSGANFLPINDRSLFTAADGRFRTLVIFIYKIIRFASLTVIMREVTPRGTICLTYGRITVTQTGMVSKCSYALETTSCSITSCTVTCPARVSNTIVVIWYNCWCCCWCDLGSNLMDNQHYCS